MVTAQDYSTALNQWAAGTAVEGKAVPPGRELDAIAAVFIGGASMSGGSGKIVGAVVGAFIMGVMNNGMSILGIGIVVSSALYFADRRMKADDNHFRGFPALWNAAAFYLFLLHLPPVLSTIVVALLIVLTWVRLFGLLLGLALLRLVAMLRQIEGGEPFAAAGLRGFARWLFLAVFVSWLAPPESFAAPVTPVAPG